MPAARKCLDRLSDLGQISRLGRGQYGPFGCPDSGVVLPECHICPDTPPAPEQVAEYEVVSHLFLEEIKFSRSSGNYHRREQLEDLYFEHGREGVQHYLRERDSPRN
jgi:hypothetical protein